MASGIFPDSGIRPAAPDPKRVQISAWRRTVDGSELPITFFLDTGHWIGKSESNGDAVPPAAILSTRV